MTAVTLPQKQSGPSGLFFIIGLFIAAIVMLMQVVPTSHALKHDEAEDIRRCLDNKGPAMVFFSKDRNTFYLTCQLDDGRWGIRPITSDGYEKTAFVPKDGSWVQVRAYLERFSSKYTGKMPDWFYR